MDLSITEISCSTIFSELNRKIKRAKDIVPNCTTYLLEGRGHMNFLTDEEKKMIVGFLLENN